MLLGVAVFSASLMCLVPFCNGESQSKELEIKAIPTWDVKHDIGPSGPVTDLHCDVGDVSISSLLALSPAASTAGPPQSAHTARTAQEVEEDNVETSFSTNFLKCRELQRTRVGGLPRPPLVPDALIHPVPRPRSRRPTPSSCLESLTSSQTQPTFD